MYTIRFHSRYREGIETYYDFKFNAMNTIISYDVTASLLVIVVIIKTFVLLDNKLDMKKKMILDFLIKPYLISLQNTFE